MSTLNLILVDAGFPSNFSGDLLAFKDSIINNITATIDSSNLILGKVGGAAPVTNIGPWLNGQTWYVWDGASAYVPAAVVVGNINFQTIFSATLLTANRTLTIPDKDGTLALTSDAYNGRTTMVLPDASQAPPGNAAATPTIDWSKSNNFYHLMTVDATYTMSNSLSGQEIAVVLVQTLSNKVPTFTGVSWVGGVATTPHTTWTSGTVTDMYIFENIAGTIYGRALLNMS